MSERRVGILTMAYGTPAGPSDIERYYTDIRGGRPPSAHLLDELTVRYAAIGNTFPLLAITREQGTALEKELNRDGDGRFRVYLGMKHSPPFIKEGVARMREDGIRRAVGLVLAPHYSRLSVGSYIDRVNASLEGGDGDMPFTFIRNWHDHPLFIEFLSSRVDEALSRLSPEERRGAVVMFSAHSLPARILDEGDPYPRQLQETADAVAARLGLASYTTAWQSAGRTPEPWLGPDVEAVIRGLAGKGHPAAVVCPCGFVADHLEILYDLDIEARQTARQRGIRLIRTDSPNAKPEFIRALAAIVKDHLEAASTR